MEITDNPRAQTGLGETLGEAIRKVQRLRANHDALLAALKRLTGALAQTVHPGASAELDRSLQAALDAIAQAEAG